MFYLIKSIFGSPIIWSAFGVGFAYLTYKNALKSRELALLKELREIGSSERLKKEGILKKEDGTINLQDILKQQHEICHILEQMASNSWVNSLTLERCLSHKIPTFLIHADYALFSYQEFLSMNYSKDEQLEQYQVFPELVLKARGMENRILEMEQELRKLHMETEEYKCFLEFVASRPGSGGLTLPLPVYAEYILQHYEAGK